MNKRDSAVLVVASLATATVALVGATSAVITKVFSKLAFNRAKPKILDKVSEKLSKSYTESDYFKRSQAASAKLESLPLERVEITALDGTRLVGHWQVHPEAKRIILAAHGWRSSWSNDFGVASEFWNENQCSVLYIEQRGQGQSGGDYMGFGMTERFDIQSWISWINQRSGGSLPIYLAGISMGASTVLMASGMDLPENVHGIMADCGFTSAKAIWKHVYEDTMHLPYNSVRAKLMDDICKNKIRCTSDDYSTLKAMETNTRPVLFVHGTDDSFVPVTMTYENYKACKAPKRLLIVPGAEHGLSFLVEEENYKNAVLSFFRDYD